MVHPSVSQKRAAFRALHQSGCFVLPNPWDAGSASVLASLGFKALATTSSGYAWSCARVDGQMPRDEVLAHMRYMVQATHLPVNADFESGYADTPEGVAESVHMAVGTGVAGISSRTPQVNRASRYASLPRPPNVCAPRVRQSTLPEAKPC